MHAHASPASSDVPKNKRPCHVRVSSSSRASVRVFDVETLLERLLVMLDLPSVVNLIEILASNVSWQSVLLQHEFWDNMLVTHFGGDLPRVFKHRFESDFIGSEDEDSEDEEDEKKVEEEEPSATTQMATTSVAETTQMATLKSENGGPNLLVCLKLTNFVRSAEQLKQFDTLVQIVQGDIERLKTIGEQRVDGLVIPTESRFRESKTDSAASAIFRRAGSKLRDHVAKLNPWGLVDNAIVTAGFDAGVDKLILYEFPSRDTYVPHPMRYLILTYTSVLKCIQQETLHCVAVLSISTHYMGLPVDRAAWIALCTIQQYIRSVPWTATIVIVCRSADTFSAYTKSKAKVMNQFNAAAVGAYT